MKRAITFSFATLAAVVLVFLVSPKSARVAAAAEAGGGTYHYQCDFKVVVDSSAADDNHVDEAAIQEHVRKFIDAHENFNLSDLQNIKIPNSNGRSVLLQEVASVQVEFHRPSH